MKKSTKETRVEYGARQIRHRTNIRKIVLHTIASAGVLSLALLAPNALQLLAATEKGSSKKRRMNPKYLIDSTFGKLLTQGLVNITEGERGKIVRLTDDGKHRLAKMIATSPDSRKHKRWDKRWRIVMYDISEKRKGTRIALQRTLQNFGFYQLQASVWIYPYPCEELLILLKADFKVGHDVLYGVIEKIEGDTKIREYFHLK